MDETGHLSDAQVEQYGDPVSAVGPEADDRAQRLETHLAECESCRQRVLAAHRTRFALLAVPNMTSGQNARRPNSGNPANPGLPAPGPDCPDEDDLRNLAAGLCPTEVAIKLTRHAAECDHCGPLLRMYSEDFSEEVSSEEKALLGRLKSSSAGWQKKLSGRMVAASGRSSRGPDKRSLPWRWILAPAALAACAAIALAVWYQQRETPEKVEKLLAESFTQQRTMDMRLPGAAWGRMAITLGTEGSRFSKPQPLFTAEEIIGRKYAAEPNNVEWLRAKAESEILEQQPAAAITTLNRALEIRPESGLLLVDLSIASVQQAQRSGDQQGYARAMDLLTQVTQRDPNNRDALFNLGILYGRLEMWDQAAVTWRTYLRLDPEGPWANEAKQQLHLAESKLKSSSLNVPDSITPAVFLGLSDSEVEFNSERYQDMALQSWLSPAVANPGSREYRAVSLLAETIRRKHSDLWLVDFIGPPAAHDGSGARALSAAVGANIKGHYVEAVRYSSQAERFFKIQHNIPGILRARYESLYASQRLLTGKECVDKAGPLEVAAAATSYRWLQTQIAIERAICLNFIGKIPESDSEMATGLDIALRARFPVLVLRDIGIAQSLAIQRGKYDLAWNEGLRGLASYWSGPASVQRIYQFYVGLALTAEHKGFWSAAASLQGHAVEILGDRDEIQRGAALLELAKIFAAEKQDDAAERIIDEANLLFDRESQEPTSRSYRLIGKIGLAELQARNGRTLEALATLFPAEQLLSPTSPYFVSLNYYRTLGNIQLQLQRFDEAERTYKTAIVIAEDSLGRLRNEQDRLQWIQASSDAYRGMVRVLLEQHRDEDALRIWEWYESRPSADAVELQVPINGPGPRSWERLWQAISRISWSSRGVARVVFVVFEDGVEVSVIHDGRVRSAWTAVPRAQLELAVKHFADNCARRDSALAEVRVEAQELFGMLLQPVIDSLPPGRLVAVELDRPLVGLPIEALRSRSEWFFAEKYPVIYSPGLVNEKQLRRPTPVDANSSFLLIDAARGLPGQELEREAVALRFPRNRIIGPETDLATMRALLTRSSVLGFMGHGEPNGTGTALRVSPALLLKAEDFPPQALQRLQLAVLAACASGSGREYGLLDQRNLVHTLFKGGVPNVVASGWDIDSLATGNLIKEFYAQLASDKPVPIALFVARNQALKTNPHPYFWGGLFVFGKSPD